MFDEEKVWYPYEDIVISTYSTFSPECGGPFYRLKFLTRYGRVVPATPENSQ